MQRPILRAFIAGGSAIAIAITLSQTAFASPSPTLHFSGSFNKSFNKHHQGLAKIDQKKSGPADSALSAAMSTFQSVRESVAKAFQLATVNAQAAYDIVSSPANVARKNAIMEAATSLQSVLASSAADSAKLSAKATFKAAVKAANENFKSASEGALARYKAAIMVAQQSANSDMRAANIALHAVLSGNTP